MTDLQFCRLLLVYLFFMLVRFPTLLSGINASLGFVFIDLAVKCFMCALKNSVQKQFRGTTLLKDKAVGSVSQSSDCCYVGASDCCLHSSPLLWLLRKMTFGKVNEMGQFIREAEPEPDVKKSKGTMLSLFYLSHYSLCIFALTLSHFISRFVYSAHGYKPHVVAAFFHSP